jgi:hypothetical protein
MFFFVFEIDKSSNCHNCNGYHHHKKSVHGQSSFTGVIKTAAAKTITAITNDVNKALKLCISFVRSIIAPAEGLRGS